MNPVIFSVWFGDDPQWTPVAHRWLRQTRERAPGWRVLLASDRPRELPADVPPPDEWLLAAVPLLPFRSGANGRGLLFDRKGWLVLHVLEQLAGPALYLDHDAELQQDPASALAAGPWRHAPLALPPDAGPIALPLLPPATMRCAGIMWFGGDSYTLVRHAWRAAFTDLEAGMPLHILREQAAWSAAAYRLAGDAAQLPVTFNWVPQLYGPDHGRAVVHHWHGDGKFHRRVAARPALTIPA